MRKVFLMLVFITNLHLFAQPFNRLLAESHHWAIVIPMDYFLVFDSIAQIYYDTDSSVYMDPLELQNFEMNYPSSSYYMPNYDEGTHEIFNNAVYIVNARSDS